MSAVSSILNQAGFDSGTQKNQVAEDKEMFLKLLVTQLSNQDPLNPVEDKEFISQLAQFTSLEELQKINTGIETLGARATEDRLVSAVNFVGKRVVATGNTVTKWQNEAGEVLVDPMFYTNDVVMKTCTATVLDKSTGNVVWAAQLGTQNVGEHAFEGWDGKDFSGKEVGDGYYEVIISGTDESGAAVLVKSEVLGTVIGVELVDGVHMLRLSGGRQVPFTEVTLVSNAVTSSSTGSSTSTTETETESETVT